MVKKIPERFVPLSVDAYLELAEVSPMAELLYYRMLQWAKKHPQTEGVVPDFEVRGSLARGMRPVAKLQELQLLGKILSTSEGWKIRVWYKFNPTKDEVLERHETRIVGAHIANHKQGRHKLKVRTCPLCYRSSDRYSDRYSERSSDAPSDRYSDAELESFSSLARAKPSATAARAESAAANAHGNNPHTLTLSELNNANQQTQHTHGWPLHPNHQEYGGYTDHSWTNPMLDPRNEPWWPDWTQAGGQVA